MFISSRVRLLRKFAKSHRRFATNLKPTSEKKALLENFPYIFESKDSFHNFQKTRPYFNEDEFLTRLSDGFEYAYVTLLSDIASCDSTKLKNYCENNLTKNIQEELESITPTIKRFELLNTNDYEFSINLEAANIYIGTININREKNSGITFHHMNDNLNFAIPSSPSELRVEMLHQIILRIQTSLKLNVIFEDETALIPESKYPLVETHLLQVEGYQKGKIEAKRPSLSLIIGLTNQMKTVLNPDIKEWIITDLDYSLKGNPIISS